MQKITLMAALADNGCIGHNNTLPWHLPEDFAFFKAYTTGKPVLMGRKTWESLPRRPLPNRRNLVISRQHAYEAAGAEVFTNPQAALAVCTDAVEVVVIGGAQLYAHMLPEATDLRLTEVHLHVAGDAFFPEFDRSLWRETARTAHIAANGCRFDFVHWQRAA